HCGPRLGIERCGKRNVSNSGAESWTGIGVVAGIGAVVRIMQWPHGKKKDVHWGSKLLHIRQVVRSNCKTRNQVLVTSMPSAVAICALIRISEAPESTRQKTGISKPFAGLRKRMGTRGSSSNPEPVYRSS